MKRVWTKQQSQAINAKGGSLIVSAAAGSGKTAVLVERVISHLIDKDNPIDADRILVVTYTRAAAAELKERLNSKLTELIRQDPSNKALLRQQTLLSKANISTIDSFCSSVVKEFFYVLNIERNFRIADDSELSLIKNDALKLTLDSMYADAEPDFFHLVEAFSGTKDDSALQKNILKIHEFLRSHPYPDLWIEKKLSMFSDFDDIDDSVWNKIILDYTTEAVEFLYSLIDSSFDYASCDEVLNEKLTPMLSKDRAYLDNVQNALDKVSGYTLFDTINAFDKGRFPTIKGYTDNYYKLKIQQNRSVFCDTVASLQKLYTYSKTEIQRQVADLFVVSQQLFNCVTQFSANYQNLKAAKKIADYPDLEHWTIKLLVDSKTLEPTEIAYTLRSRFDEIMIDEYQDANDAQDLIFSALSNNNENLFFVGDVKQSIYGFRQAMPQLFLERKKNSTLFYENDPDFPAKIFLDKNFRSSEPITQAVNFFFTKLMSESVGDINYDDTESLKCGATYESEDAPSVCYHILDLSELDDPDSNITEAEYIAQKVMQMIAQGYQIKDGNSYRNVTYGDFAVLMRNANKHAPDYVDTLIRCGVPAFCDSSYSFLSSPEIMVMTNFLSIIDNPELDIELLSVMMSTIYGFTSDDMTAIRLNSRYTSLYKAVMKTADMGDSKCQHFLSQLKFYRDLSITTDAATLIGIILERTGYLYITKALPESDLAVSNLLLLKEYAKNFEAGNNKGLSRFVSYLSRLKENDSDIAGAVDLNASSTNAVHVMSIHASKGLEYPVCIIANTTRRFVSDVSDNVLLHSDLGIAVKHKDETKNATFTTMPREALALSIKRDEMSEELRVLYVAMTRAKQKFIMLSSHKDVEKYLQKIGANLVDSGAIMPFVIRNCNCISDWVTMCALIHPDGYILREMAGLDIEPDRDADFEFDISVVQLHEEDDGQTDEIKVISTDAVDTDNAVIDTLIERTSFEYKNAVYHKLPSKVSASELSHKLSDNISERLLDTPAFMSDNTLTAAGKGTALHAFMQFCDFERARADINSEIARLQNNGYISEVQAQSIDIKNAERFVDSELITRCINSPEVHKEYRFTIEVNADVVDPDIKATDKKVILQGAVDLAFVEDGELVIVDYKTDRVKSLLTLRDMYHNQLEIYKDAMEQCTDYKVKECLIYSVQLGDYINV